MKVYLTSILPAFIAAQASNNPYCTGVNLSASPIISSLVYRFADKTRRDVSSFNIINNPVQDSMELWASGN